jgi:ubiquinone/menaquinone biosynthesis C-methylase UbiE
MNEFNSSSNEQIAAEAFNKQSYVFDKLYSSNPIIQYKRERVRNYTEKNVKPGSHILELNAGTGEDAVYFAQKGYCIHATDISSGMLDVLKKKIEAEGLTQLVTTELCSFTELKSLQRKGPYDLILSNFAGLNCTDELDKVLKSFTGLLKPDGLVILVIMPGFCLWEILLALSGKFKTAFRRFNRKHGVPAHIEGVYFTCWYYSSSYVMRCLKKEFDVLTAEGLCTIVPPSYFENFPKKYPKLYLWLQKKEAQLKNKWPWKYI